jgi:hypothetical protein
VEAAVDPWSRWQEKQIIWIAGR